MAETQTTPDASAVVEEETFEIVLPEDDPEPENEPEPEPEPEPEAKAKETPKEPQKPKPEAKVEPEPEPEPEPEKPKERVHLDPIAREERSKRKEYARLYAETKEQLDAAERRIRLLQSPPDPKADDPELQKWHKELLDEAKSADDLSKVLALAMREMDRRDQAGRQRDRARIKELNASLYELQCDLSETRARQRHSDWEQVVRKAGMLEAVMVDGQGRWRDEAIAKRVYYTADGGLAPDPAERMYRLAVGKLEYERVQKGEPEDEPEPEPKKAQPKAKEPEATAEARGAQRVIEQVSKNASRLKGISRVPNAGQPQRVSKKYLDELLFNNPSAYERLIAKNPELERFHFGGT